MRRWKTILLGALSAALLSGREAGAETLQAETLAALGANPALAGERARLRAVREALPLAWAEALPQISLEGSAVETDRSEPRFAAISVREQPEFWAASVRTSTLLFGSGRVEASTRQARARIASAVARYQEAAQSLILDLTRAYGQARFAFELVAAQEELLANLEQQARYARANLREGFLTRTDVAQAEARVAQARAELANARGQIVQANEAFTRLTGHAPSDLEAPGDVENLPLNLEIALAAAEDSNPTLIAALADTVVADAGGDLAASNGRARVFLETNNSTFDVIGRSRIEEQYENTVGVRVTVPIFTGGATRAQMRQQRHIGDAARFDLAETQRRLHENVVVAFTEVTTTRERVEASRARLEAAELATRGARLEQQYGQRSMIDVLNQEQELIAARVAVAQSERDAMIAQRALMTTIGQAGPLIEAPSAPRSPPRRPPSRRRR